MLKNRIDKLKRKKKKGFTLVELLIVIAILAILGLILVPSIGAYRQKAEKSNIQASAKTLKNAIDAYNTEHVDGAQMTTTIDMSKLNSASGDGSIDVNKLPACLGGTGSGTIGGDVADTISELDSVVNGNFKVTTVSGLNSVIDIN